MSFEMRFDLGTLDSGEQSLPFGLLVKRRNQFSQTFYEKKTEHNPKVFHSFIR